MTPTNSNSVEAIDQNNNDPRRAALLAMNRVPAEATGIVGFATGGRVLVVGGDSEASEFAQQMSSPLQPTVVLLDTQQPDTAAGLAIFHAERKGFALDGYMGDFKAVLSPQGRPESFDLVVDFCDPPLFDDPWPRLGYHQVDRLQTDALVRELEDEVGEFEKPRYFKYDPDLCVRGSSGLTGCNRCLEACPAGAITGLAERIEVDPHLCQGGGICATVCPGGALQYRFPSLSDSVERLRSLIKAFLDHGGQDPEILIHDDQTTLDLDSLPGQLLPFAVEELPSVGMEFWLTALAFGARAVHLHPTSRLSAASGNALEVQLENARALLDGLGYPRGVLTWFGDAPGERLPVIDSASFAAAGDKREVLYLALDHLTQARADSPPVVSLPATAPLGEIQVDQDKCTLCVSCATVCPRGAVTAEEGTPALVFFEARCVQCGLCEQACPEDAIRLASRFVTDPVERNRRRILHEEPPFECIRCGKPFATRTSIEAVLARLEGHSMFGAEEARNRLKMCGDCRVVDMLQDDGAM